MPKPVIVMLAERFGVGCSAGEFVFNARGGGQIREVSDTFKRVVDRLHVFRHAFRTPQDAQR